MRHEAVGVEQIFTNAVGGGFVMLALVLRRGVSTRWSQLMKVTNEDYCRIL